MVISKEINPTLLLKKIYSTPNLKIIRVISILPLNMHTLQLIYIKERCLNYMKNCILPASVLIPQGRPLAHVLANEALL